MNDKKPASLSSDLLARKGEAQPFSIDPSERMTPYLSAEPSGSHFGGTQFDAPMHSSEERAFPPEPEIIFTPEELEEGRGRGKLIAGAVAAILVIGGLVFALSFQGDRGVAPVASTIPAQTQSATTGADELRSSMPSAPAEQVAASDTAPALAAAKTDAAITDSGVEEAAPVMDATPVEAAKPVPAAPAVKTAEVKPVEVKPVDIKPVDVKPVATAPAAEKPAAAKADTTKAVVAAGGAYVVQLLALRDEASAQKAWAGLQKKYPSLRSHANDIERADLGAKGIFYRLRAAGFTSKADATSFCNKLKAAGQDCMAKQR